MSNLFLQDAERVEEATESAVKSLEKVQRTLKKDIVRLYKAGQGIEAIDYATQLNSVNGILVDAGYYEFGGQYYTDEFQSYLNSANKVYKKIYPGEFRLQAQTLEEFNLLRDAAERRFTSLGAEYANRATERLVSMQFGGVPLDVAGGVLADNTDTFFNQYVKTWVRTSSSDFHSGVTQKIGVELGAKKWVYDGVLDDATRRICERYRGKSKTREEWESIPNGQTGSMWDGRGGWNCRHRFYPEFAE
jgi:hypothetical protein